MLAEQRAKYGATGNSGTSLSEDAVLKRLRSETAEPYEEKKKIIRQMWAHFGQVMAELPHGDLVVQQAKYTGLNHLQQAYHSGKGGFLCSAHFGNWEIPFWKKVSLT